MINDKPLLPVRQENSKSSIDDLLKKEAKKIEVQPNNINKDNPTKKSKFDYDLIPLAIIGTFATFIGGAFYYGCQRDEKAEFEIYSLVKKAPIIETFYDVTKLDLEDCYKMENVGGSLKYNNTDIVWQLYKIRVENINPGISFEVPKRQKVFLLDLDRDGKVGLNER